MSDQEFSPTEEYVPASPSSEPAVPVDDPNSTPGYDPLEPPYVYSSDNEIETEPEPEPETDEIILLVRDGLDQPIENLPVIVEIPTGATIESKTTEQGAVTLPPLKREGSAKVSVKSPDGRRQPVCTIDLAQCKHAAIVRSPKIAVPVKLKTHTQTRGAPSGGTSGDTWYELNGALRKAWRWVKDIVHDKDVTPPASPRKPATPIVKQTVSKAGNPLTVVAGPECPNSGNLRLGQNNIYRAAVIKAAQRCGLMPQAVAALIDAEAAKRSETVALIGSDGKPLINKKTGKARTRTIKEQWKEDSYNAQSRAGGLTQFLESTWLSHVMKPGYFIHEQSVANGWVRTEANAGGKSKHLFALANGTTTAQPWKHTSDANVQACLKKRFDAEWSIMAAADYGKANLKLLEAKGFKIASLNDAEKAKLMYLMHHEGEGNGPLFIRNQLHLMPKGKFATSEARLKHIFRLQVGASDAEKKVASADSVSAAYRAWLAEYIDGKIDTSKFTCSGDMHKPKHILTLCQQI